MDPSTYEMSHWGLKTPDIASGVWTHTEVSVGGIAKFSHVSQPVHLRYARQGRRREVAAGKAGLVSVDLLTFIQAQQELALFPAGHWLGHLPKGGHGRRYLLIWRRRGLAFGGLSSIFFFSSMGA